VFLFSGPCVPGGGGSCGHPLGEGYRTEAHAQSFVNRGFVFWQYFWILANQSTSLNTPVNKTLGMYLRSRYTLRGKNKVLRPYNSVLTENTFFKRYTYSLRFFFRAVRTTKTPAVRMLYSRPTLTNKRVLGRVGLVLRKHTWLGDLRLNSYLAIVEPLEGRFFISGRSRGEMNGPGWNRGVTWSLWSTSRLVDWINWQPSRPTTRVDQGVWRFYIRLGRHPLDRSFVLNSNSILIYWYSFTSNELYSQV
jgi:hypothetical protein